MRAVQYFLAEHLAQDIPQEALARQFSFPLTSMKKCFQAVTGSSIGAWVTTCRMNRAAEMLTGDRAEDGTADVGCCVGYDSASKFAAAFRRTMGMTPSEYRMERGGERMKTRKKKLESSRFYFAYAEGEKEKMLLSVILSVVSVTAGLAPFYCM